MPYSAARQRAGAVQDALQHRVEVEAFVDPKVGLVQTGQALTQRFYVSLRVRPGPSSSPSIERPAIECGPAAE